MLATCLVGAATAGALLLAGQFAPAAAVEPSRSTLVITAYDATDPSEPVIAEMTLKCEPTGGTHPRARRACATLESVDGNFDALEPLNQACILLYQPVIIEVGGNWRDRVVSFTREYPNLCVAGVESEGVFRFPRY
jgi:hypothetical protein